MEIHFLHLWRTWCSLLRFAGWKQLKIYSKSLLRYVWWSSLLETYSTIRKFHRRRVEKKMLNERLLDRLNGMRRRTFWWYILPIRHPPTLVDSDDSTSAQHSICVQSFGEGETKTGTRTHANVAHTNTHIRWCHGRHRRKFVRKTNHSSKKDLESVEGVSEHTLECALACAPRWEKKWMEKIVLSVPRAASIHYYVFLGFCRHSWSSRVNSYWQCGKETNRTHLKWIWRDRKRKYHRALSCEVFLSTSECNYARLGAVHSSGLALMAMLMMTGATKSAMLSSGCDETRLLRICLNNIFFFLTQTANVYDVGGHMMKL